MREPSVGPSRAAARVAAWISSSSVSPRGCRPSPKALAGVRQDPHFRTNIALANFGETQAVTTLQVLRPYGTTVKTRAVTVGPLGFVQLDLANDLDVTNLDGGSVVLSCSPATCQVGAYASVIDAKTADPRTILPR